MALMTYIPTLMGIISKPLDQLKKPMGNFSRNLLKKGRQLLVYIAKPKQIDRQLDSVSTLIQIQ